MMNPSTGAVEATAPPGGLFSGYTPPTGTYDELQMNPGAFRAPWAPFVQALEAMGPQGLNQRAEQARRTLRENGVTYNVYAAPEGPNRPWELDPIPLLLARREWTPLAEGIAQRARLLDALMADIYGRQELIRLGILPPKLVFAHPGFLHACHGLAVPHQRHLHLYGAHLTRQPNGSWIVLADRTQGPSGAGYAVENRIVISRTLPHDFQSLHVERLASFYIALREMLLDLATRHRDNPRVVLLTPGPRSSAYFEDGYLARYLGYTLVEGGDLTVRGQTVYLKTLGGLLPVDVILRRMADDDCDPLELKPDALHGVPGLVQAARAGHVAIANALGSGLLEAPALMAFLPAVCRALLGEDLRLPSVPTWWCGREEDRAFVTAHLDELIIRPALLHRSAAPILGWQLSRAKREELLFKIAARPGLYVGQARVERSTAPVWAGGALQPWRVGLRAFAVAHPNGYRVLPGGLSRVSAGNAFLGESMAAGEGSKDVWVLAEGPVQSVTLLSPPRAAVELRRSFNDLPSRAADNLFWLGRHLERAEGMVRHLRSIVVRMTNELEPSGLRELELLANALCEADDRPTSKPATDLHELFENIRAETLSFLFNDKRPIGLNPTLQSLQRTASFVRDRLSIDAWRIVHQMDLNSLFSWPSSQARLADVLAQLNQLLTLLSAFSGLGMESMTRGPGWRFLDMGRRVERALHTLRLIQNTLVSNSAELIPVLEAILEIADSTMTYRYRYLTSLQLAPVLDLILVDETNPRAVGFQLSVLADHVRELPGSDVDRSRNDEGRILLAAQAELRLCDVDAFRDPDQAGIRQTLDDFVERIAKHLRDLSDSITQTYLTHTGPSRQLGLFSESAP